MLHTLTKKTVGDLTICNHSLSEMIGATDGIIYRVLVLRVISFTFSTEPTKQQKPIA